MQIFDLPEDDTAAGTHLSILDSDGVATILSLLKYPSTLSTTTSGRFGQTKKLSKQKDFTYPTEYDPPEFIKKEFIGSFPVTSATPKNFKTTKLGPSIGLSGSKTSAGKVTLDCKIDRKVLLRLVNYGTPITSPSTDFWGHPVEIVIAENRIEKPNSEVSSSDSSIKLNEGIYLMVRYSPVQPSVKTEKPTTEYHSGHYLVLIRVATSKQ